MFIVIEASICALYFRRHIQAPFIEDNRNTIAQVVTLLRKITNKVADCVWNKVANLNKEPGPFLLLC